MSRRTFLILSLICRVLGFVWLVALLVVVFGFLVYLGKHMKHDVDLGMALAVNGIGIALVWACPFCRLADYFERKGDQAHD